MKFDNIVCVSCLFTAVSLTEGLLKDISTFREFIALVHNFYRSYERASDMKELRWDPYLESRAEKWSENCYFDHQRDGLGENLAYFWTTARVGLSTLEIIIKSCQNWWKEVNDWHWSTDCGQACHYTQMIWGNTERIGCALSKCASLRTDTGRTFDNADYFVCFYDPPGNFIGRYPYTLGEQCTKCSIGETCSGGLCSKPVDAVSNSTQVNFLDNLKVQADSTVTYTERVNDPNSNPKSSRTPVVRKIVYWWTK